MYMMVSKYSQARVFLQTPTSAQLPLKSSAFFRPPMFFSLRSQEHAAKIISKNALPRTSPKTVQATLAGSGRPRHEFPTDFE